MPAASDDELLAATENYLRYLRVVRRIIERTKLPGVTTQFANSDRRGTLGDNAPSI